LPFGSRQQIIQTVHNYKRLLGAEGGFILSPAHHIQSDTSLENIEAFYEEALRPTTYDRSQ